MRTRKIVSAGGDLLFGMRANVKVGVGIIEAWTHTVFFGLYDAPDYKSHQKNIYKSHCSISRIFGGNLFNKIQYQKHRCHLERQLKIKIK